MRKLIKRYQNPSDVLQNYKQSYVHQLYSKDKPLSPNDPIGEFIVGQSLLKPVTLIPKLFKYGASKFFPKSKLGKWAKASLISNEFKNVDTNSFISQDPIISNELFYKNGITYRIPSYATINSKANPIALHKSRIKVNWDKIPNNDDGSYTFKEGITNYPFRANDSRIKVLRFDNDPNGVVNDAIETISSSIPSQHAHNPMVLEAIKESIVIPGMEKVAFSYPSSGKVYLGYDGANRIIQEFGEKNLDRAISHELDHAIHIPTEAPYGFNNLSQYFSKENGTELSARGSQLKDYFGLRKDEELTEDMLRYAKENYIKDTGLDNNMSEFFNLINDFKNAAKWLDKHATAGLPFIAGSKYNNKHQNK